MSEMLLPSHTVHLNCLSSNHSLGAGGCVVDAAEFPAVLPSDRINEMFLHLANKTRHSVGETMSF